LTHESIQGQTVTETQDRIAGLVKSLEKDIKLVGQADEGTVSNIESGLGVSLPDSFKWFLKEYGLLMLPAYIIYGSGNNADPACLKLTLGVREKGLPAPYVVIENDNDGRIICLDTSRLKDGECPVVGWETQGEKVKDLFSDFYQLLESKLADTQLARQPRSVSS
jgi:hypothetical protein